ncbi:translation initiation factor eIF3 subunit [Cylindrobasidium torrendii FP15055 ss-10]|uniref:Eukaryotic translation initiation factor 3 subunit J n=1 Tax=Cylindrobasidium torrendii FP15055 ss-10 TaxID=1314674 RepID=A0A0D7AYW4_9AGAR|nr:translation initiation factor eIF3 subunit [Cylindrobasidium torrendii FP15055 ss-10]
MSDWDDSDNEAPAKVAPPKAPVPKKQSKWDGEDAEDDAPVSDWEASSDEEVEKKPTPAAPPPKKKGTLKAKIAEKEAAKAARAADGEDEYDEDAVLDPREKARRQKELELNSDLNNAADLLGSAALGGTTNKDLDSLLSFQPRTKDDFIELSNRITELIIQRHQSKPLYAAFVEHHVRALAQPLKDVEVRKAASGLTTLANEKQKEARDKSSGKKKATKTAAKPAIGKSFSKVDTSVYDEALDDFGDGPDDFM